MPLTLNTSMLYSLGIIMIFVGIIVILTAFVVLFLSSIKSGKIRGGGALIIGPIPIVFGTDKESVKTVLWLSITLTIILFAVFIILHLLRGR
jgi:uncharacterized membrane protein